MENITTITALFFISLATAIGVIVWRYATFMYAHLEARSKARETLEAQATKDIPMVDKQKYGRLETHHSRACEALESQTTKDTPMVDKQEDDGQAHKVFHECGVAYRIPVRSQTQLRRR